MSLIMLTIAKISPKNKNRQTTPKDDPDMHGQYKDSARASCPALPGSMTVEAALVLPVFLFAMVNLLSLIVMFQTFSVKEGRLHQTGRELALLAYGSEEGEQDIRLVEVSQIKPVFSEAAFFPAIMVNGCVMHKWIGYDLAQEETAPNGGKEEMVYITKSGTAYHRQRECVYLNPSIQMMEREQAERAKNDDGSYYSACGICGGDSKLVYVTQGGSRFHSTVSCSGLKRTIETVTLQEAVAAGRHACPKCG